MRDPWSSDRAVALMPNNTWMRRNDVEMDVVGCVVGGIADDDDAGSGWRSQTEADTHDVGVTRPTRGRVLDDPVIVPEMKAAQRT